MSDYAWAPVDHAESVDRYMPVAQLVWPIDFPSAPAFLFKVVKRLEALQKTVQHVLSTGVN
jgi:hypothetical protein